MKILQIIYESSGNRFGFGGAGVRAYEIYRRLTSGHEITFLCMRYAGATDSVQDGIRHVFVGAENAGLFRSVITYTLKASLFVKRYGDQFDVIVENFLPSTPFFSRFLTKTPVILQIQGVMERHALKKFPLVYALPMFCVEKLYPRLNKRFLFVSDITMAKVMTSIHTHPLQCAVIPNGVDMSLLETVPEEGNYILFLSRIDTYTKGLDLLLQSFTDIASRYPDLAIVLAGYAFSDIPHLMATLPDFLQKRVHYAGFVSGEEKKRLLASSLLAVLPSRHESFPVSVMEAAACGKPLLTSDIPELSFVEKNAIGMVFRSGSRESLTEKLNILVSSKDERKRLGMNGRQFARSFIWDRIAVAFESFLREAVEKRAVRKEMGTPAS